LASLFLTSFAILPKRSTTPILRAAPNVGRFGRLDGVERENLCSTFDDDF
jgi:hypothetical protein